MSRKPWSIDSTPRKVTGRAWRKLRDAVLLRDRYTCRACGRIRPPSELACDHVVPLAKGGTDNLANLQTLCGVGADGGPSCHELKTLEDQGKRSKPRIGLDGWPIK